MVAMITTEEYENLIRAKAGLEQVKETLAKGFEVKENVVKVNTNVLSKMLGLDKDATFVFTM